MARPVALFLRELRVRRGLTQGQAAKLLGYEQGYWSSIEVGAKAPSAEFIDQLKSKLKLSEADSCDLEHALGLSERHFTIPVDAPKEVYELINTLFSKIDVLHPVQVDGIASWLNARDNLLEQPQFQPTRIKRKTKTEAAM